MLRCYPIRSSCATSFVRPPSKTRRMPQDDLALPSLPTPPYKRLYGLARALFGAVLGTDALVLRPMAEKLARSNSQQLASFLNLLFVRLGEQKECCQGGE